MTFVQQVPEPVTVTYDGEFRMVQEPLDAGSAILAIQGDLDIATAPACRSELNSLLDRGIRRVIVDLTTLSFIDSVALAVLVNAGRRLHDQGQLALVVPTESYSRLIFEASGIDSVLPLFDTRADAVDFLRA